MLLWSPQQGVGTAYPRSIDRDQRSDIKRSCRARRDVNAQSRELTFPARVEPVAARAHSVLDPPRCFQVLTAASSDAAAEQRQQEEYESMESVEDGLAKPSCKPSCELA